MWSSSSTKRSIKAVATLVACLALAPPAANAETALVDVLVNGSSRGTASVELDRDGAPRLDAEILRRSLGGIVAESTLERISEGGSAPSRETLEAAGIRVAYDGSALALSFEVRPESMVPSRIGFGERRTEAKGERTIEDPPFALTLGFDAGYEPSYSRTEGAQGIFSNAGRLGLSPAIRSHGLVAEGDISMTYDDTSGFERRLDGARVVRDFPALGARLEAGMVDARAVGFQASRSLYGASFFREESLPGARARRAAPDERILVRRDADATVEVNGIVVKRLRLKAGSYSLSDLPLASGLNEVVVTIGEEGSPPRVVRLGIPFDDGLLGAGEADYSLTLGSTSLDAPEPFGAGRVAIGLGAPLQAGLDAESSASSALGGASLSAATRLGIVGAAGALSGSYGEFARLAPPAWAARGSWRLANASARLSPRFGAAAEYRSAGFSPPGSDAPAQRPSLGFSAQVGQALPSGRGSLSLFGQGSVVEGGLDSWSATLGANMPIGRGFFLSVSGGADWRAGSEIEPRATAIATLARPGKGVISYGQSYANGVDGENLSIGLDKEGRSVASAYASGLMGGGADRSVELAGSGRSRIASLGGRGRYVSAADGRSGEFSGGLSLSSTLAFAGGALAATGEPGASLAILKPDPALRGRRVELRPAEAPPAASPAGRTTMIVGLVPYSSYAAGVELPDSPPDARPDPTSIVLKPAYRSVSVVRVGLAPSIAVHGRLVDEKGRPIANMPGDLVDAEGKVLPFTGIFTDESGIFECYGLEPGRVVIRWADGSAYSFSLGKGMLVGIIDLGDVNPEKKRNGGSR